MSRCELPFLLCSGVRPHRRNTDAHFGGREKKKCAHPLGTEKLTEEDQDTPGLGHQHSETMRHAQESGETRMVPPTHPIVTRDRSSEGAVGQNRAPTVFQQFQDALFPHLNVSEIKRKWATQGFRALRHNLIASSEPSLPRSGTQKAGTASLTHQ